MDETTPTKAEFWDRVFPEQVPTVWRGAASEHPMVLLADSKPAEVLGAFADRLGERPVQVAATTPRSAGKMGFDERRWVDWSQRTASFADFAQDLLEELERPSGHCLYMQSAPVDEHLPELLELCPLWLRDSDRMLLPQTQLWVGSGGQRVAIHQDATHSLGIVAAGTKEFTIYPPEQLPNLYPAPRESLSGDPWRSVVDPRAPDLERYPRFESAAAVAQTIRLEAGDLLFLPAYWWHAVDSHDFNVMFNLRWHDITPEQHAGATAALAHALIAARAASDDQKLRLSHAVRGAIFEAPVDGAQRERHMEVLRANTFSTSPGPEEPLRLPADLAVTLREGGVQLGGAESAALEWSFLPILGPFARRASPAAAFDGLSQHFDVDRDDFFARVTALAEAGVLCVDTDESGLTDDALAATVAHAGLCIAPLPSPHRVAFATILETFGFLRAGDPLARGLLAVPMPDEGRAELEALADADIRARTTSEGSTSYRVAAGVRGKILGDGEGLVFRGARVQSLSWEHLEVLAEFATATRPGDVLARIGESWSITRAELDALIAAWIDAGLLERARAYDARADAIVAPTLAIQSASN